MECGIARLSVMLARGIHDLTLVLGILHVCGQACTVVVTAAANIETCFWLVACHNKLSPVAMVHKPRY